MNVSFDMRMVLPVYREHFLDYSNRWNIYFGSRASGKTKFCFQFLLMKSLKSQRRVLLLRKTNNKVFDTIWLEAKTILDEWGLTEYCTFNKSEQTITFEKLNGTVWTFRGVDEPERLKGMIFSDVYLDEVTEFYTSDLDLINGTLRSKKYGNLQIICSMNPVSKANFTYTYFGFDKGIVPPNTKIVHTTWRDNPYLDESFAKAMDDLKARDYQRWLIDSEGQWASTGKLVIPKYNVVENIDWKEKLYAHKNTYLCLGCDFGYTDPTAFICAVADEVNKELWIFDEHYERGMDNPSIAKMIKEKHFQKEVIFFDCAEPKSIQEIRRDGITRAKPCRKGRDSIKFGIQKINQYTIYVDSKCIHTIEEFQNYEYKKDKVSGEYTSEPLDNGYCHLVDALRYSLQAVKKKANVLNVSL